MSSYITWADLVNRYSDAAKLVGGAEAVKSSYINGAEAQIDAAAALRYTVPFTPVPEFVKDLAVDLAYFKIIATRQKLPEGFKKFIDERLNGLACGSYMLTSSGVALGASETAWSTDQYPSSFGVDDSTLWQVSSGWQQAFDDRRC